MRGNIQLNGQRRFQCGRRRWAQSTVAVDLLDCIARRKVGAKGRVGGHVVHNQSRAMHADRDTPRHSRMGTLVTQRSSRHPYLELAVELLEYHKLLNSNK